MKQFVFFFCGLIVLWTMGCSSNIPLSGKVTFSDDGSPLTAGTVMFEGTIQARGEIQPNGTYRVGTKKLTDGIPAGTYKVYISGAVVQEGRSQIRDSRGEMVDGMAVFTPLVAQKFTSSESSGLNVVVDKSTKTFDFTVDRPQ